MAYKTIIEDGIDILVVGAGLGGSGAAWEARFWGQDKKIVNCREGQYRSLWCGRPGSVRYQLLHGHPVGRK